MHQVQSPGYRKAKLEGCRSPAGDFQSALGWFDAPIAEDPAGDKVFRLSRLPLPAGVALPQCVQPPSRLVGQMDRRELRGKPAERNQ